MGGAGEGGHGLGADEGGALKAPARAVIARERKIKTFIYNFVSIFEAYTYQFHVCGLVFSMKIAA